MTNDRAEQRLLSMGRTLIRWRVTAVALVAVMTAFFGYHALQLRLVSRFDELLPATHPFIQVHRKFAKTFGGANTVLIMLRVRQGDIFNIKTLNKIWAMTQELDKIYGVNHYQIESLAHRTNRTIRVSFTSIAVGAVTEYCATSNARSPGASTRRMTATWSSFSDVPASPRRLGASPPTCSRASR